MTRYLADTVRLEQILDCGSGLPTVENTHEVAARLNLDAGVVYLGNDPVVAAHCRALLAEGVGGTGEVGVGVGVGVP